MWVGVIVEPAIVAAGWSDEPLLLLLDRVEAGLAAEDRRVGVLCLPVALVLLRTKRVHLIDR